MGIKLLVLALVLLSFSIAIFPAIRRFFLGKPISYIDFAIIGYFIYHFVGIFFDAFGLGENQFFGSIFSDADTSELWKTVALIVFCPLILRFLDLAFPPRIYLQYDRNKFDKVNKLSILIILIIAIVSVGIAYFQVRNTANIWESRSVIGENLGIFIIILYLPLYFFVYYCIKVKRKNIFILGFIFSLSVFSALVIGQRTLAILPLVVLLIFRDRINFFKLTIGILAVLVIASSMLFYFKPGRDSEENVLNLIKSTITDDFYRTNVLHSVISDSEDVGTKILPYLGSGYVYSLLFFLPRQFAPFKGDSSAAFFTSYKTSQPLESLTWGFGVGFLEESVLNFGYYFSFLSVILFALILIFLQRITVWFPDINVPVKLGAIWIFGYHLPAVLLLFVPMTLVIMLFSSVNSFSIFPMKHLILKDEKLIYDEKN